MPQAVDYAALAKQAGAVSSAPPMPGLLVPGTVDLSNRPRVKNPDGSVSTVRSIGVNIDGKEVLIPTVIGNRVVSNEDAIAEYKRTGQHLGIFDTPEHSTAFAQRLHESEAAKLTQAPGAVDYAALAKQAGAVSSTPAPDFKQSDTTPNDVDPTTLGGKALNIASDVATGFGKGAAQTAFYTGKLFHSLPVVGPVLDAAAKVIGPSGTDPNTAFASAPKEIQPEGIAQHIGSFLETLGEMAAMGKVSSSVAADVTKALSPYVSKAAAIVPRVVEGVRGAAQAALHGENPIVGGALGAVLPGTTIGNDTADALRTSAEKNVAQGLGATKERFKAVAERRAGEILDRGVTGTTGMSREALLETARTRTADLGKQIAAVIDANKDQAIPTKPILDAIEAAKGEFQHLVPVPGPVQAANAVPFVPRAVKQLDGLKDILSQYGDSLRVDQAVAVRRAWDKIVADAGGYSNRAGSAFGVALKDASEAATKRTATSAIRQQLDAAVPDLAALDKEYSFWKDLQAVTTATLRRTQAQGEGLGRQIAGGVGSTIGALGGGFGGFLAGGPAGSAGGAAAGAVATKQLAELAQRAFTSPRWAFIKAGLKNDLAESIVSGNAQRVWTTLGRVISFEGASAATALTQK